MFVLQPSTCWWFG